jgi:PAS domain S-box-containing protein
VHPAVSGRRPGRAEQYQWRAVFENNPIMSFGVDAAGILVSVNPSGAEQLGYTVDELIGRSCSTCVRAR